MGDERWAFNGRGWTIRLYLSQLHKHLIAPFVRLLLLPCLLALTGMGAVQNCKGLVLPCLHLFVLLRRKQKHACGTPAHSPPPYRIITARSRYGTIKFSPKKPLSEPKLCMRCKIKISPLCIYPLSIHWTGFVLVIIQNFS